MASSKCRTAIWDTLRLSTIAGRPSSPRTVTTISRASRTKGSWDVLFSYILPAVAVIVFWTYQSATPGKMVFDAKIVDAESGKEPSTGQLLGRYFAYVPSTLILGFGFFWIAWDPRKQAWHDKLANTLVVKGTQSEA